MFKLWMWELFDWKNNRKSENALKRSELILRLHFTMNSWKLNDKLKLNWKLLKIPRTQFRTSQLIFNWIVLSIEKISTFQWSSLHHLTFEANLSHHLKLWCVMYDWWPLPAIALHKIRMWRTDKTPRRRDRAQREKWIPENEKSEVSFNYLFVKLLEKLE